MTHASSASRASRVSRDSRASSCLTCKTRRLEPVPVALHNDLPIHGTNETGEPVGKIRMTEIGGHVHNATVLVPGASDEDVSVLTMVAWLWEKAAGDMTAERDRQLRRVLGPRATNVLSDLPTSSHVQDFFEFLDEHNQQVQHAHQT